MLDAKSISIKAKYTLETHFLVYFSPSLQLDKLANL